METLDGRMKEFQDVMAGIEKLYVWQYILKEGAGLSLIGSNCPEEEFWHNVFMVSFSRNVLESCEGSEDSVLIGDDIGILWIATPQWEEKRLQKLWLLGPVFSSDIQEFGLNGQLEKKQISVEYKRELVRQLRCLPSITHTVLCVLGALQHFCVTNSRIRITDIRMQERDKAFQKDGEETEEGYSHSGAEQEALMLKAIRDGDLHYGERTREIQHVVPGVLAPGNALRQFQDEIITEITLCSRAAIQGGLPRKRALKMSDEFIQAVEAATTLPEVGAVHYRMREEYIRRVHDLKQKEGLSPAVIACLDYVDFHITDHLSVVDVAASTGYAGYYISRLFQKEMNQSLLAYIQKKKIDYAAFLLENSDQSVRDVAETLHYSSPSHFCTMFRREKGMTPTEYRGKGKERHI